MKFLVTLKHDSENSHATLATFEPRTQDDQVEDGVRLWLSSPDRELVLTFDDWESLALGMRRSTTVQFATSPRVDSGRRYPAPLTFSPHEDGLHIVFQNPERRVMICWDDWETLILAVRRPA